MGQAKLKQRLAFAPQLIAEWEAEDCVNFAVALARETRWLLHVDWWTPSTNPEQDVPIEKFKPLRVYVADNHDKIFDVRGVRSITDFNNRTIRELASRFGTGGVRTRFYGEADLSSLPLRVRPEEAKVQLALTNIRANSHYLATIEVRSPTGIPAHLAAPFAYGRCAAFAQALHEETGLESVAMLAIRFASTYEGTSRGATGYIHSVVLHEDGMAEDCWGKASLTEIAGRFGATEFRTSGKEQQAVAETLRRNSPDLYAAALQEARDLIRAYRR
jgi:hypothetical protein